MEHPLLEGVEMSALDGVRPLQYLVDFCKDVAINGIGREIRKRVGLGRKDSVEIAFRFMGDYINPIVSKLDPLLINRSYRYLVLAERLGSDLLTEYMFKGDSDQAKDTITELVWKYPEHGFVINTREARRIGLKVTDAAKFPKWKEVWKIYDKLSIHQNKIIHLTTYSEFEQELSRLENEELNEDEC
jgi:hypothetical protein